MEYHSMSFVLLGEGEPDRVQTGVISANGFEVLGVKPILGRGFRGGDDQPGAPPVLILSHRYWLHRFGGDPGIIGKSLQMNDKPIEVVGVLPPLPDFPGADDVFMPNAACPFRSSQRMIDNRNVRILSLYGLLKTGAGVPEAQAEMKILSDRLHRQYPDSYPENADFALSLVPVGEELTRELRPTIKVLIVTVSLVLLIACANVGNLALARLLRREREMVLRAALGASRSRLVRQVLTESVTLALGGGLLGLLLAKVAMGFLVAFARRFTPLADQVGIDSRVLLFALGLSALTGVVFGLLPALQATRRDLVSALKQGGSQGTAGRSRHRLRSALVVAQIAVSYVLLVAGGLTAKSVLELRKVDAGFKEANVIKMDLGLPFSRYRGNQVLDFYKNLLPRIEAFPGVVSTAVASSVPLSGDLATPSFEIEGRDSSRAVTEQRAASRIASPDYFKTLGIPLLKGRTFLASDDENAPPIVVVNQAMARHFWPGEDAVGKRIDIGLGIGWITIVGVVGDVRQNGLDAEAGDAFYFPFLQFGGREMTLFVRTAANPMGMVPRIRVAIHDVDPEQPVSGVRTLEEVRSESATPFRLVALLLVSFSVLAFIVTVAGLSGMMAFLVTERTREIGIRSALGADRESVLWMVFGQGMALVLLGLILGGGGALIGSRLLSSLLFGVRPGDPVTLTLVSLVLLGVAAVTCLLPARRAASIDPMVALRS
jgi:predicted permease